MTGAVKTFSSKVFVMDSTERNRAVQSVDRALDLLEALAGAEAPVGVTELARQVGLPQGTTHRLLLSLAGRGFVRRDRDRRYAVGLRAMALGSSAYRQFERVAHDYLAALVALSGETANLAVLEGTAMTYVAQAPSPHRLRIFAEVGRRVPLHSTAVGKAVLAQLPREEALALLDRTELTATTPLTLTTPEALGDELDQVARRGYALDEQEQELGVRCVAVALPEVGGLYAAVSISGPAERFTPERAAEVAARVPAVLAPLAEELATPTDG